MLSAIANRTRLDGSLQPQPVNRLYGTSTPPLNRNAEPYKKPFTTRTKGPNKRTGNNNSGSVPTLCCG